MQYTTLLIKHAELTEPILNQICGLKSVRWNYTLEQHKEWIKNNILNDDIHLLVIEDEKPIAYTNLVSIAVNVNNIEVPFMGIGNVCTLETGKNYGNLLMRTVNDTIKTKSWNGILLCKDHLVPYYGKFGWDLIDKDRNHKSCRYD